jgi:NADPH-dependent 7-cyano-7-deazaguanine reductase QueF-like protein
MPEKTLLTNTLSLTERVVNIPFTAEEMKGNPDKHYYEIDFLNLQGKPFITIGGVLPINAEINRK